MKVAVLGAGFQGACTSLELARRNLRVDLIDLNATPITQAGLINEGKIHLGFVYANDPSMATARTMLEGALRFSSILERWVRLEDALERSTPFLYPVHTESGLGVEQITHYFRAMQALYERMQAELDCDYLEIPKLRLFERLSGAETAAHFAADSVVAAFRTAEYSVCPRRIARSIRAAIEADPAIAFVGNSRVTQVERKSDGRLMVRFERDGSVQREEYDHVINALWDGRLRIDKQLGLEPKRAWLCRFKAAVHLDLTEPIAAIPSFTMVHGRYGDVVNYASGRLYLSWYPSCMLNLSSALEQPGWRTLLDGGATADRVFDDSLRALARLCPPLRALTPELIASRRVVGGSIFAWGATDIDDPSSELHRRADIGVESAGSYHTMNTGKYSMAPLFALQVCDRITGSA